MLTNTKNLIDHTPLGLDNLPSYLKFSINYSTIWLGYTIFMTIIINIVLLSIIFNLKVEYKWQRDWFFLLLFSINVFYFLQFKTTFVILFILFFILIIISAQQFIKNIYQDYMLQRVQNIKFKNVMSKQKITKKENIKEAFWNDIALWIELLFLYIDKTYGNLWKYYIILIIIIIINIILLLTYLFVLYWSAYYVK